MSELDPRDTAIAVVGMACRVPGASDIESYWQNLLDGVESIEDLSDQELREAGELPERLADPAYVRRAAALEGMAVWDREFFGLSPREAAIMDPQHRHFLELSWEALESAGHAPGTFDGRVGVFAGCGAGTYMMFNLLSNPELLRDEGFFLLRHIGNDKDFLATRVAYHLNLTGPAVSVQTACSTSLAAIHMAGQSLLSYECDAAIAGGVTITHPHRTGYLYREGEILSRDGRCRAFDAQATGTVLGDGAGAVVLRRYADAVADGDSIWAVIRGSAINNDGAGKVGYLAPSVDGQTEVVSEALAVADVDPGTIGYVEAHGTGTRLGDPIEVAALTRAFRQGTERVGYCGLGSVKTNIGHLDTAAGVAGFIKAVLAVHHGEIPLSLHFREPNPELELDTSPFRVIDTRSPWPVANGPRRAGISSLGVGGTNVHVIIEQAPDSETPVSDRSADGRAQLIPISGHDRAAVGRASDRLVRSLEREGAPAFADVAWTLQAGRASLRSRRFVVAGSADELVDILVRADPERIADHDADDTERRAAFLFAGGGAQHAGMTRELMNAEPIFRRTWEEGRSLIEPALAARIERAFVDGDEAGTDDLDRPSIALPGLFLTQYAHARLWMEWGVRPAALMGHSMGEYTAACLAGVLSLDDAMGLVVLRGELFESVRGGSMLAVPLDEDALERRLPDGCSIAAVNGPELCVASGPSEGIAELAEALAEEGVDARRIRIDVAAHSGLLDPILDDFRGRLVRTRLSEPRMPVVSNLTGTWLRPDQATDPEYWVRQLRHTVRFSDGLATLLENPAIVPLEIGPGRTLSSLARIHPACGEARAVLSSIRHPADPEDGRTDRTRMLHAAGVLWQQGVPVEWSGLHEVLRRRVPLPTYPFAGERYLIEPGEGTPGARTGPTAADAAESPARGDGPFRLFRTEWREADQPAAEWSESGAGESTVLVGQGSGIEPVARRLPGARIVGSLSDIVSFEGVERILHVGLLDAAEDDDPEALECGIRKGVLDFLALARRLGRAQGGAGERLPEVVVMTSLAERDPRAALVSGPVRVLPQELPGLRTRWIQIDPAVLDSGEWVAELARSEPDLVVRLRPGRRELPIDVPVETSGSDRQDVRVELPAEPVVLITGGTGGLGLEIARHLVRSRGARVVLLGRTPLPDPEASGALPSGLDPAHARAVETIAELRADGGQVMHWAADVADAEAMNALRGRIEETFGTVDLVIHAAGVLDDELAALRSDGAARRVLEPKVVGAGVLRRCFRDPEPAAIVHFSSISARAGLPGQLDYASANAYLDARAAATEITLAWSAWGEVGMVVDAEEGRVRWPSLDGNNPEGGAWTKAQSSHFDAVDLSGGRARVRLREGRLWFLDEHRGPDGIPIIPAAGLVELIVSAAGELFDWTPRGPEHPEAGTDLVLESLEFVIPFRVPAGTTRELEIRLDPDGPAEADRRRVRVLGRTHPRGEWVEHLTAALTFDSPSDDHEGDPEGAVDVHSFDAPDPSLGQALQLGPRWSNVRGTRHAKGRFGLLLELSEMHQQDPAHHLLHPALLDNAMALAGPLVKNFGSAEAVHVPAAIEKIRVQRRLPARLHSRIERRGRAPSAGPDDLAELDVAVRDLEGRPLVDIHGLTLVRVPLEEFAPDAGDSSPGSDEAVSTRADLPTLSTREGLEILDRVLDGKVRPGPLVVAPEPPSEWVGRLVQAALDTGDARNHTSESRDESVAAIENALLTFKEVTDVAVTAHQDRPGETRFVAHVVIDPDHMVTVSELRRRLRDTALEPEWVPRNFVELDQLPRRDSGAVDRRALRDPLAPPDTHVEPETPTQRAVAQIWSDLLGTNRVGVHDNFLDLGGHSLLAMRAVLKIEAETGVRPGPVAINLRTLGQIAAEIDQARGRSEVEAG